MILNCGIRLYRYAMLIIAYRIVPVNSEPKKCSSDDSL